jgi:hypothetical protein
MSSLQKFHRRTNAGAPVVKLIGSEAPVAGAGFWLGTAGNGTSKMYVAPKSTETSLIWGSFGTARGAVSTTNGLANTNTLAGFGQAAHPAAYYAKNLTTGGYNTWYLPAKDELNTLYSNKYTFPFATANQFEGANYWSSTESGVNFGWYRHLTNDSVNIGDRRMAYWIRAVRMTTV